MVASSTSFSTSHDGLPLLLRRWEADVPRAAMLLVHGIGEHTGRYEHVGDAFSDAGIDVLAHDQRGFGRSGGRPAHVKRFDEYLDDIQPLLAERHELGVPVILMGHSLGGLISTTYLVTGRPQPDLAVLSAPALDANAPRWQRIAAPVLGTFAPRLHIKNDFDGTVLSRDPAVQEAYENDPLRVDGSTASLGRAILRSMKQTRAALDRLRVPTYVLHGADDTLVPPSASEPLDALPNVTRRLWPGLRHECMNEPEQADVIGAIVTWVDSQLAVLATV